jgi:hypothetical protein
MICKMEFNECIHFSFQFTIKLQSN